MNEYSKSLWGWGLGGALLAPAVLLALDGLAHRGIPPEPYRAYVDALFVSFAGMFVALGVPALPIFPWIRMILFFLAIPVFIWAVHAFAPWAPMW